MMLKLGNAPKWLRREMERMVRQGHISARQAEEVAAFFVELAEREAAGGISTGEALRQVVELAERQHRERLS